MRILFICPSLEPGRDGVGDYTRRLAVELKKCGHDCLCIAANDRHIRSPDIAPRAENVQSALGPKVVRLPSDEPWGTRFATLRLIADDFAPDWVSLQYVPHGFHIKGLPLGFARRVVPFASERHVHIMFHELWGGSSNIVGRTIIPVLQKRLLLYLCTGLSPRVLNVTNEEYQQRLASMGIASTVLPLFGNIPVLGKASAHRNSDEWVFAIFGTLRRGWRFERLLLEIERARLVAGKKQCRFVSVGRLGACGQLMWESMEQSGYKHFVFEKLGELEESDVSRALHSADFGVAVSPFEIIDKSGAVAAMREHGLPVVVTRFRSEVAGAAAPNRPDLILLDDRFQESLRAAKRLPCRESLPLVAEAFIESLKDAE